MTDKKYRNFKKPNDFLDGDHSFKKWFKIMWSNGYIFIFLAFMALAIATGFFPNSLGFDPNEKWNLFVTGFGIFGMALIAYKGFYQFWKRLKGE